jgi:hypothetical protein
MPEWKPGVLAGLLKEIDTAGRAGQRAGMLKIAAAIEALAKAKLSETSHRAGTPSPASKGGPPSLVTGTGRRSIGHQYIPGLDEAIVKVGTIAGVFPPKPRAKKGAGRHPASSPPTASSKYLLYQETLARFNHPFLKPAFDTIVGEQAVKIWLSSFRKWPKL